MHSSAVQAGGSLKALDAVIFVGMLLHKQPMAWIYLILAGFLEIGWAVGLKYSAGFTKPMPTVFTLVTMSASVALLSLALRSIPLGTGYAVWTGIGAVGTAIAGMVLFAESRDVLRLACIVLIVSGIVGLKLLAPASTN